MRRLLALIVAALFVAPFAHAQDKPRIAVIPKGTTHVFWKSVEAGAREAGEELGAEIVWRGPLKENDRAGQIQVVQQFVTQGVDGIVIAPLDHKALVGPIRAAKNKGIPVVIIDSALDGTPGEDFVSFVATNNRLGGELGGEHMGKLFNGQGKIAVLRYQVGSASTDERETGFLEKVRELSGIEVITDNRYAGATAGEAQTAALNMMDRLRAADGVFTPNESSTMGMLLALRKEGIAGKKRFVGFDASPPLVEGLRNGEIDALVVQNPRRMGSEGVRTLIAHLRGEKVEPQIDTGVVLVTKDNLDSEEVKPLIASE